MNKFKIIVILILIIAAFLTGIYFKDNVAKFFIGVDKQVKNFQKTEIGATLTQVGKQILSPPPLNIGGAGNNVVLLQSKIIAETNSQRKLNGNLPALVENKKLDEAASAKASDMFKNQYFEHVSPLGVDPGKLAQSYGYEYIVEGENLILGNFSSEKEVVQDWMNSPEHRANILNNRYTEMGAVIVKGTYQGKIVWIGVQEFGLPFSACNQPSQILKNEITFEKNQLDSLSLEIDNKKNEINNTDSSSSLYGKIIDDYNKLVAQYNSSADQVKKTITNYNSQVNIFNNCVAGK
jgi:uncharacterized protein YkwD